MYLSSAIQTKYTEGCRVTDADSSRVQDPGWMGKVVIQPLLLAGALAVLFPFPAGDPAKVGHPHTPNPRNPET